MDGYTWSSHYYEPDSKSVRRLIFDRYEHLVAKKTAEPQSKKDDSDYHNKKLIMDDHSLETRIEKLLQQVKDLQRQVRNINATKKKRVRFLLRDAFLYMSVSDLKTSDKAYSNSDKVSCASL